MANNKSARWANISILGILLRGKAIAPSPSKIPGHNTITFLRIRLMLKINKLKGNNGPDQNKRRLALRGY